jgi:hypothetical protein
VVAVLSGGFSLFSVLCLFYILTNFGQPDYGDVVGSTIAAFIFMGCIVAGLLGTWWSVRPQAQASIDGDAGLEQRILALASARGGSVTVAEVALICDASLRDSKSALRRMVGCGVAEVTIDARGDLVYTVTALTG